MSEFLIKVRKNIQNALKVQVATMHRSMQNPLIHSIHQSIGVVMDKFLELVAEEIEFSANEILKDMQNKKRRPARLTHCPLEMYWSFLDYEISSVKQGYFDQQGYFNHIQIL